MQEDVYHTPPFTTLYFGLQEAGGRGGVSIEGREVDQFLNSSLLACLRNHSCPVYMDLTVLEVPVHMIVM